MKEKLTAKRKIIKEKSLGFIKKSHRGILRVCFSRTGLIIAMLLLQLFVIISLLFRFEDFLPEFFSFNLIFSMAMVFYLLNSRIDPSAKITWLIVILLLPIFGSLLFAYTQSDVGHIRLKNRTNSIHETTKHLLKQPHGVLEALKKADEGAYALSVYASKCGTHPVFSDTEAVYLPSGKDKFEHLIDELKKAKQYIFIEYFILNKGYMWDSILEILKEKASKGVDVRVMYDGTCEFALLPHSYPKILGRYGIKCKAFAPIKPFLSTRYNYRDHRKIFVIDGKVAFTGGINLSDEYMNIGSKYGEWKDASVKLKGSAAKSFALMFLELWALDSRTIDADKYFDEKPPSHVDLSKGFVMPYCDKPLDGHKVGESFYIDILNRAKKYVHIMTPYLILDGVMEKALCFAAERGVEVTLILPGIPDKKGPYALAKTHYRRLLDSGVKIYEFTPGFVHAKVFSCDGTEAVVGTINLDYRSLYHHFECAAYLNRVSCLGDIEKDFAATISRCRRVSYETIKNESKITRLSGFLLKAIAPLL